MRWLAAALALLFAVPATAQDKPEWVGVWEGNVGTYPVRPCIDVWGDGPARGSYYYLSQLEPIALSEEDGEGGWIERSGDSEAEWNFTELTGTAMRGNWRQLRITQPFALRPVAWTEGEWGGPCSSAAFLAPRVGGGTVESEEAFLVGGGVGIPDLPRFTVHRYRPPPHLDEISVEAFTIPGEQPGDVAINAVLEAALPRGTVEDEFAQCLGGAIAALGTDGYFEHTLKPVMFSRVFLTVEDSSSTYCGGAHPNHWTAYRTFDRQNGEELDLFGWIGEPRIDGDDSVLPEALRAEVAAVLSEAEGECGELAEDASYWSLGLRQDGMLFWPDLPHVATACEEAILLSWDQMQSFLDAEGRAGLARLREP